ncbi:MAG: PP2C family protein-serine/threonine phosphatase [Clostridia bacterium]|nr:PP2C family protein-serine/threonine phosphatase [Clostridia bacterium]
MPDRFKHMSKAEKRRRSLSVKTIHSTVKGSILLGLTVLVVGLGLYGSSLINQSIQTANNLASYASVSAIHGADSVNLAKQVMAIFRSLTPEQRAKTGTEEYRQYFSSIDTGSGTNHRLLTHMMETFISTNEADDVYMAMFEDTALVYLIDPAEEDHFETGEWEPVERREANKFLHWNGKGNLYDISNTEKYGWMCTAGVPIRDDDGTIVAFLLTDIRIDHVIHGMAGYALRITLALIAVTALFAWRLVRRMQKTTIEPINSIAEAAAAYAGDKREGIENTSHFASLNIHTGDELENLSRVMSEMEQDISRHEEYITRITAEKERIGTEMQMATRIQEGMMPHAVPDRKEFDVFALMDPAKEVGGDFYDYFMIDQDHLCLVIADVSGKGVPAALFMMASKIILQSCAMLGSSAGEILTRTNQAVCSSNRANMFLTVWLGILEISTGKMTCANAGHEYPFLARRDEAFKRLRDKHGFVIGGMDGVQYQEYVLNLQPGDRIFVYTDGVTEANSVEGELFGMDRLQNALNRDPGTDCKGLIGNVRQAVDTFALSAPQFDDITMLSFTYNGPGK